MDRKKKYIFGNWKMNKNNKETKEFFRTVKKNYNSRVVAGLAVPYTDMKTAKKVSRNHFVLKSWFKHIAGKFSENINIIAQDVCWAKDGNYTGEISISMLREMKVKYSIVGHAERRLMFGETDQMVNQKTLALLANKMTPILCVGEDDKTRAAGKTDDFVQGQLKAALKGVNADDVQNTIICYQAISSLGTNQAMDVADSEKVCLMIRDYLTTLYDAQTAQNVVIIYDGGVNDDNVDKLIAEADIDGVLVGINSLDPETFKDLINFNFAKKEEVREENRQI